jgi:integrase/recombinase XerD
VATKVKIPTLDQLVADYLICCRSEGKSPKTIESYSLSLRKFSEFLKQSKVVKPISEIGLSEVRRFIIYLQNDAKRWDSVSGKQDNKKLSPFSVFCYVRSIKPFWSWALADGYISVNPLARLKPPRPPRKIIMTFTKEQVQNFLLSSTLRPPTASGYTP